MRYLSLVFALSLLVTACQSQEEKDKIGLEKTIRQITEDDAFKRNAKIDLLEIKVVSYDEVDKNHVDTLRKINYYKEIKRHSKSSENYYDLVNITADLAAKCNASGRYSLASDYRSEMKEHAAKGNLYYDSVRYWKTKDSMLTINMRPGKVLPKDYLKVKFYCKATIGGENTLDTLQIVTNKNYQYIDVRK